MNIVQVSHGFPPEQSGGTERYTTQLAQALQERGHSVTVFARRADGRLPEYALQEERLGGVRVVRINNTWRACSSFEESYHHPVIARRFGELLDRLQPDVVHIQHLVHLSTHLPDEIRKRQIPLVMTFHDYWLLCNQGQLLRRDGSLCTQALTGTCTDCAGLWLGIGTSARRALSLLERWWPEVRYRTSSLRRLAHGYYRFLQRRRGQRRLMGQRMGARREEMLRAGRSIEVGIAPSAFLLSRLVGYGLPAERLIHLPYGIRTEPLASVPRPPSRVLRAAYLGRIIPAKGIHVLLEAAARLRNPTVQVHIYGGVPPYGDVDGYARRMRRQAMRNPRVRWHGAYNYNALGQILAETDVVVVPSVWYECQPLVILEAFAAHTPVVTTDLGGMRELVRDGHDGLLFPRGDASALARCIDHLAEDQGLLERLRQGIAPVKDIETHVKELEAIYERLRAREVPAALVSR